MSKMNLEFLIDIEGDDADLKKVKSKLLEQQSALEEAVVSAIQEKMDRLGLAKSTKVRLPASRVTLRAVLEGGLSAQEWLEKGDMPEDPDKEGVKKEGFRD